MNVRVCAFLSLLLGSPAAAESTSADPDVTLATRCAPYSFAERTRDDLWMVDKCGAVFRSGDQGRSWRASTVFSGTQSLLGLLWPSEGSGLAIAASGKIATAGADAAWREGARAFDGTSSIARAGKSVWVCDRSGRLARSDDGGASWTDLAPTPIAGGACGALAFANGSTGWLAGAVVNGASPLLQRGWTAASRGLPALWRTSDGGKSWRKAGAFPEAIDSMTFALATPSVGWVFAIGADRYHVFHTRDGGDSWRLADIPGLQEPALKAQAARTLWVSGFDLAERTGDKAPTPAPSEAVAALDEHSALIVQDGKMLLFKGAQASPMLPLTPGSGGTVPLAGSFKVAGEHWAWGQQLIFRSEDGGATWYRVGAAPEKIASFVHAGSRVYVQGASGRFHQSPPRDLARWSEVKTIQDRVDLMLARDAEEPVLKKLRCITRSQQGELQLEQFSAAADEDAPRGRVIIRWTSAHTAASGDLEKLGGGKGERQLSSGAVRSGLKRVAAIAALPHRKCSGDICETTIVRWTCDRAAEEVFAESAPACTSKTGCRNAMVLDAALHFLPKR